MRDLEEVDGRQTLGEETRIDLLLDVSGEKEPASADRPQEDDGHVVDPRSCIRRLGRHLAADRPQDAKADLVDREVVAGGDRKTGMTSSSADPLQPGRIPGSRTAHPRLEDAGDGVSIEEQRETGDMIFVRMAQDQRVDTPVPWRDALVQLDEQSVGIRAAVDEQPTATRAFDQDRVALADVQHRHARDAV